ncbi:MAG: DUF4876 domain-containing protein [Candidatus Neomarinimicrobiota bacterium]
MVKKGLIFLIFLSLALTTCFKDKPTELDGTYSIRLVLVFRDSTLGYDERLKNVTVQLHTDEYSLDDYSATADDSGVVVFENLAWASFDPKVKVQIQLPYIDTYGVARPDSLINYTLVDTVVILNPTENAMLTDTIFTITANSLPGLKINEIYYTGPENRNNWFYDQYVELYNSSEEVKYLDGMIVCRIFHMLDRVTYAFQFPGEPLTGTEYPVQPGEFVVLAADATNWLTLYSTSVDLSGAAWEFVNTMDFGDTDNPNALNLHNIMTGKTVDFMINLSSNVIAIADGSDSVMTDGLDIGTVVDCVEYCSISSGERTNKDIDKILDQGWAGIGNQRYSGQSVERILPGFDTNNSFNDFVIIKPPTPGYQH